MSFCHVCKVSKDKLKSCVCRKVSYCSKECQTEDWKAHRSSCPIYVIRESPGKGRGFFATRKIKKGQIILEEYPLLVLEQGPSLPAFQNKVYPNIDEETKSKILQLFDPAENFRNLESRTVKELFRKNPRMSLYKEALSASDEMSRIWRIFLYNAISTCGEPDLYSNQLEMSLYNFSLLNHCCVPNVVQSWVIGDYRRRQLRALRDIEKDEEILTAYCPTQEFVYGTRDFRRQKLLETSAFLCECSVCSLEGEDLEENERIREEIRDKEREIDQLMNFGSNVRIVPLSSVHLLRQA